MKRIGLTLFLLSITAGCGSYSKESGYPEDLSYRVVPNVTSQAEVLKLLGPPATNTQKDGVVRFQYQREVRGTRGKLIPLTTWEFIEEASKTDATLLIIDIDSGTGTVLSIERRPSK